MQIIVSADDCGLSKGITDTIFETVDRGALTSVSVLPNGPALPYAITEYRKRASTLRLAVHLNLTEGESLTGVGFLTDANGLLRFSVLGLSLAYLTASSRRRREIRKQIRRELSAQIVHVRDLVAHTGPIAVDGHQHVHMLPFVFDELCALDLISYIRIPDEPFFLASGQMLRHLQRNGIARAVLSMLSRRGRHKAYERGISTNDRFIGFVSSGKMTKEIVARGLRTVAGSGCVEIAFHPGIPGKGERILFSKSSDWYRSESHAYERDLLLEPGFAALLRSFETS